MLYIFVLCGTLLVDHYLILKRCSRVVSATGRCWCSTCEQWEQREWPESSTRCGLVGGVLVGNILERASLRTLYAKMGHGVWGRGGGAHASKLPPN